MFIVDQVEKCRRQLDKWGGHIHIYIRVLPNLKSIRFQKKFNCAKHEYVNMSTPLIEHSAGDATEVELQKNLQTIHIAPVSPEKLSTNCKIPW